MARDKWGRLVGGGGSLNPGGVPKVVLEARRAALDHVPAAMARCAELLDCEDNYVALAAIKMIFERGLGRPPEPDKLPEDMALPPPGEVSSPVLLQRCLQLLERTLSRREQQLADGLTLTEKQEETLVSNAQALALLAKEERELAKQGDGAQLSDDALLQRVLASVPLEQLRNVLAQREAAQ